MKKINLLVIATLVFVTAASAQIYNPVKWSVASKKLNSREAVVFVKATIEQGWHIYGLNVPEGGPISTSFIFSKSADYSLSGNIAGPRPQSKYEKDFQMDVPFFVKEVTFQQKIKLKNGQAAVKGVVEFMACDKSRCLPPDEYSFTIAVK